MLEKAHSLKNLNISENNMDVKSALCIAHGLQYTQCLDFIDVKGNPIGKLGMRLFLHAMSSNQNTKFKINMQDISADKQIKLEKNLKDSSVNFDP